MSHDTLTSQTNQGRVGQNEYGEAKQGHGEFYFVCQQLRNSWWKDRNFIFPLEYQSKIDDPVITSSPGFHSRNSSDSTLPHPTLCSHTRRFQIMGIAKRGRHCFKAIYLNLSEVNIKSFHQAFEISCWQTD